MKRINLYSNGSCNNHGCEAIYLSLVKILKDYDLEAYSEFIKDDKIISDKIKLIDIYKNKPTVIDTLIYKLKYKFLKNDEIYFKYRYKPFYKNLNKKNELFLSIGGDNYCYGYNEWLRVLNKYIINKGNKIVLTGCSIEPYSLTDEMIQILNKFSAIIARESITYNALKDSGLRNIFLTPDPAFILDTIYAKDLEEDFYNCDIVGINISPLILKGDHNGYILKNIMNLVQYILSNTTYNILLVPHVMIEGNNDWDILNSLYNNIEKTDRVRLIKSNHACEIKGYISKCKIFVAARTHASIAAYSSCIPTLVLGYSIKSKGIAKDIFGTYENYVLPIESIKKDNDLIDKFKYIDDNYNAIKKHLNEFIPEYKQKVDKIYNIIEAFSYE